MNSRLYVAVSGSVFAVVAILHLLRVVNGWEVMVGPWSAPMAVSWCGAVVAAALSVWALRLASRTQE